jgi:hypothetical protein
MMMFVVLVGCSADDPAGAASDARVPDDTTNTNGCRAYPGMDEPCSTTRPCAAPLTCYYEPGCDLPTGRCRVWDLCADVGMTDAAFCGCDGGGASNREPFAHAGACVEPGRDSGVDGDATTADGG